VADKGTSVKLPQAYEAALRTARGQ